MHQSHACRPPRPHRASSRSLFPKFLFPPWENRSIPIGPDGPSLADERHNRCSCVSPLFSLQRIPHRSLNLRSAPSSASSLVSPDHQFTIPKPIYPPSAMIAQCRDDAAHGAHDSSQLEQASDCLPRFIDQLILISGRGTEQLLPGRTALPNDYTTFRRRTGKDLYDGVPLCGS
jgi:hypothetical protein